MNTNKLKSFAAEARLMLMEGVSKKLSYWGFNDGGECVEEMEPITGGYEFREQVFNDPRVYPKWKNLKEHVKDQQTRKDVIERAAYTWFNRLVAVKMLEMNGYEEVVLGFREGTHTPMLLQTSKRASNAHLYNTDQELLKQYFAADDDENAFGLLITDYCHRHNVLRNVFGGIDDFTELLLPNNLLTENGIIALINDERVIAPNDFKEVELIGWLYQFYIADRKNEVFAGFKKNKKARAEDIPAATAIFTPRWIVKYMVENTLGKLYLYFEPSSPLKTEMKYLVESSQEDPEPKVTKVKNPKLFEEPEVSAKQVNDVTDLTLLDPACGSGHILVVAFDLLMKMYMEQGYNKKKAIQSILDKNIFGLDIDDRAIQLARFALLLKAATHDASILADNLKVQVYTFPEAHHFTNEDLLTFLDGEKKYLDELRTALKLLNQGKNIGSALKLEMSEAALSHLVNQAEIWQKKEASASLGLQEQSIWNSLLQFLEVLQVLTRQYTSVVANPPYMGQKSMNGELKSYVSKNYPLSKSDLFAVFMESCLALTAKGKLMGMINQHSWMFLSSYENLRKEMLSRYSLLNMLHLGPRTFPEISGEVVQSTAFVFKNGKSYLKGTYYRLVNFNSTELKHSKFLERTNEFSNISQKHFTQIPGSTIAYWLSRKMMSIFSNKKLVEKYEVKSGIMTGNDTSFIRKWFEVCFANVGFGLKSFQDFNTQKEKWYPLNKGDGFQKWSPDYSSIINFRNGGEDLQQLKGVQNYRLRDPKYFFQPGLTWSDVGSDYPSFRFQNSGMLFAARSPMVFSTDLYILGLLNSKVVGEVIQAYNPTLTINITEIENIPVITDGGTNVRSIVTNCIEIVEGILSDIETSWNFRYPFLMNSRISLRDSYRGWQSKITNDFYQLHANEEGLNRIFIEIYGLQDELTPEVELKDITILQDELDRNALEKLEPIFRTKGKDAIELPIDKTEVLSQFISYAVGCMMGRYRLDKPGLNIAHPNPSDEELSDYTYEGRPWKIDDDAIVPMMGNESPFADDIAYRIKEFVRVVWGDETLTENLNFLQECLGMDLEKFLVTKFWDYHKRMYKKRPIYWLFSSKSGAFQVLTYMHRMDKYTVQKIRQNYLHKYQAWLSEKVEKLADDEAELSRPEQKKLEYYRKAQVECKEYDEILKELAKQQIEFDLDDGVAVNYEKFGEAVKKV